MIQPPGGSRAKRNPGGQILIRRSPRQRRVRIDLPSSEADHHTIARPASVVEAAFPAFPSKPEWSYQLSKPYLLCRLLML